MTAVKEPPLSVIPYMDCTGSTSQGGECPDGSLSLPSGFRTFPVRNDSGESGHPPLPVIPRLDYASEALRQIGNCQLTETSIAGGRVSIPLVSDLQEGSGIESCRPLMRSQEKVLQKALKRREPRRTRRALRRAFLFLRGLRVLRGSRLLGFLRQPPSRG